MLDRLITAIAEAKTCMLFAAATAPASPARKRAIEELRQAVTAPRQLLDEIFGHKQVIARVLFVELRVCELAIPKLEAGLVLRKSKGAV